MIADVKKQIDHLKSIADRIGQSPSVIDRELLKKKVVDLYEHILKLEAQTLVQQTMVFEDAVSGNTEPLLAADEKIPAEAESPENTPAEIHAALPEEPIPATDGEGVAQPISEIRVEEVEETSILFTQEENAEVKTSEFLHERISKSININPEFLQHIESRVESLKSSISLNKKIAFVNDLFKENTVEYAKAIEKLNSAEDLNAALLVFTELKHSQGWDNANDLVRDLESLVVKRFS